jgi:ABC-type nickel/cobalt efflux system permease component RcnA
MDTLLKIVFPILLASLMVIGFYKLYHSLNEKITASQTLLQVLGYALILFVSCLLLFFGGLFTLFKVYLFLSE